MLKVYFLLRNNQQSGPHTRQEILAFSLLHSDLIWMEGKSNGWKTPLEIESLATYFPDSNLSEISVAKETTQEPAQTEKTTPKATHIFVSRPAATVVPVIENEVETFEERLEKLQQKIKGATKEKEVPKETSEIKYTRSLEDIKEEYTSWLQQQKRKRSPFKSAPLPVIFTLLIILLGAGFFYFSSSLSKNKPVNSLVLEPTTSSIAVSNSSKNNKPVFEDQATRSGLSKKIETENKRQLVKPQPKTKYAPATITVVSNTPTKAANPISKAPAPILNSEEEAKPEEMATVPLANQIMVTGNPIYNTQKGSLNNYTITLKNTSKEMLKVVAVDVFYYDNESNLLAQKVVYFNDVAPGSTSSKQATLYKNAASARTQLGLISTRAGLFYAMQ